MTDDISESGAETGTHPGDDRPAEGETPSGRSSTENGAPRVFSVVGNGTSAGGLESGAILLELAEAKTTEHEISHHARLDQALLDAFPCVAVLIRPGSQEIVSANRAGMNAGAVPGARCHIGRMGPESPCRWCLAPKTWRSGERQAAQFESQGRVWDAHWIPVSDGLFMHYAFDITDRLHTERELRISEARMRALAEASPDYLMLLDSEFRVRYLNRPEPGVDADDVIGTPIYSLGSEKEEDAVKAVLTKVFNHRQTETFETTFQRPDGETRIFESSVAQARLDNAPIGLAVASRDITERRRLENLIDDITDAERTSVRRDLHDTVSQQLIGIAFLADGLSDEIRTNPETAIASAHTIADLTSTALEQTQQIARGIGTLPGEPEALFEALLDLATHLRDVFGAHCRFTSRKRVFMDDSETATQLYLIAREAAFNAARHAESTRIGISLSERGRTVRLTVRDNGVGIGEQPEPTVGMGLRTMSARARLIGASLAIGPHDDGGTVVECRWRRPKDVDDE